MVNDNAVPLACSSIGCITCDTQVNSGFVLFVASSDYLRMHLIVYVNVKLQLAWSTPRNASERNVLFMSVVIQYRQLNVCMRLHTAVEQSHAYSIDKASDARMAQIAISTFNAFWTIFEVQMKIVLNFPNLDLWDELRIL